ncbi:hypothetical protein PG2023B_1015 [Bifidobacterium pseudolongum subsp. globosum]|nr:hypothetical protein PG2023B_1015 [Bifidobacterium pseudolongum subsp. globosum]
MSGFTSSPAAPVQFKEPSWAGALYTTILAAAAVALFATGLMTMDRWLITAGPVLWLMAVQYARYWTLRRALARDYIIYRRSDAEFTPSSADGPDPHRNQPSAGPSRKGTRP